MPPAKRQRSRSRKTTESQELETQSNEGGVKARYSGEVASEPSAVSLTEEERQAAEHAERERHNARTGGGTVREGELQEQLDEHNRRTGDVSRASWS